MYNSMTLKGCFRVASKCKCKVQVETKMKMKGVSSSLNNFIMIIIVREKETFF